MTSSPPSELIAHDGSVIDINLIVVARDTRQRREISVDSLKESILRVGLLHPPVVSRGTFELRSGERRLTACRELGWTRIPVRWFEGLDPIQAQIIELEENIRREELPWQDQTRAIARINELFQERDAEWGQGDTADALGLSRGHVSKFLRVSRSIGEEKIAAAPGIAEAYNILARRDQRAEGDALAQLLDDEPETTPEPEYDPLDYEPGELDDPNGATNHALSDIPSLHPTEASEAQAHASRPAQPERLVRPAPVPDIIQGDFLAWLAGDGPEKLAKRANLIHCDFPYGINLFDGGQGRGSEPGEGYSDSPDIYFELLEAFVKNLDRFMSLSSHLVFWFSGKHRAATLKLFRDFAPSIEFYPYDLIWHKSDNAGIAGDQRRHPRHTHETALLGTRSRRHILEVVADSYSCPTQKSLHPSVKPEPMLRHFFRMFVDENSRVFDPTCGSGAAIRAADSLGAKSVLGLEIDPENAAVALRELESARRLRRASATLS